MGAKKEQDPLKAMAELINFIDKGKIGSKEELDKYINKYRDVLPEEVLTKFESFKELAEETESLLDTAIASPPKIGRKQAKKIIEKDPENIEAYLYLADTEKSSEKAIRMYEKAIEVSKKFIEDEFDKLKGSFWTNIRTRPYMRSNISLAVFYYHKKKFEEASEILKRMIELDPEDSVGVRIYLAVCYITLDKEDKFFELYDKYSNGLEAILEFGYALSLFKTEGITEEANMALKIAHERNPYFVQYLTGIKSIPDDLPDEEFEIGDEAEAIYSVIDFAYAWEKADGAIKWIKDELIQEKLF